jgi:hypothetical protein
LMLETNNQTKVDDVSIWELIINQE